MSTTLPISVGNTSFLIQRVAADCSPLQEFRELTQNAIEAIQKLDGRGCIRWDVDWSLLDSDGVYKLSITDNGIGMSADGIQNYINMLSSSSREQSLAANFGIGGKITAGVNNPHGVVYHSWHNGVCTKAHYWYDREIGAYGLKRLAETEHPYAPTVNLARPDLIDSHGTMITLLGQTDKDNTFSPPNGISHQIIWLARYLNKRYFTVPNGIEIQVREFSNKDQKNWPTKVPGSTVDGGQLRTIFGQKHYLDMYCKTNGVLAVTGAIIHWWILPDKLSYQQWQCVGHTAALYQNELYELQEHHAGRRMLQKFGILYGSNCIVIYAEPDPDLNPVSNTARNSLIIDNQPLPWDQWAATFRANMPPAIKQMIDEIAERSLNADHSDAIVKRLESVSSLLNPICYRVNKDGTDSVTKNKGKGNKRDRRKRQPKSANPISPNGDLGAAPGPSAAKKEIKFIPPNVIWVSSKNGTRDKGQLEDRGACYNKETNTIIANLDFRGFKAMIHFCLEKHPDIGEKIVENVLCEWCEQQLFEAILCTHNLKLPQEETDKMLSEESMTIIMMMPYHIINAVKQRLGTMIPNQLNRALV